jgi:hypothetical protein
MLGFMEDQGEINVSRNIFYSWLFGFLSIYALLGGNMKKLILCLSLLFLFGAGMGASPAAAADISLFESAFYMNGITSTPTSDALFDYTTGLGILTWTVNTAGNYNFIAFFDHEIDESINTFFNEYGAVSGTAAAGQSWEIDEPGYVFGDIYNNVLAGTLDNTNGVPSSAPDDVSMAMGWDFVLNAGETATISIYLSAIQPVSGFYLEQTDPDSDASGASIYLSSSLAVGGGNPVPLPGAIYLMGSGLALLAGYGRKKLWM